MALLIYLLHHRYKVHIPCLIIRQLREAATTAKSDRNIIFPHLVHTLCARAVVASQTKYDWLDPDGDMAYERISDGHGCYWVPIDPPTRMGPLEDKQDASDAEEEADPMPTELIAAFVDPAAEPIAPPPAVADDVLHQILQTMQAIQTQQEH